MPPRITSYKDTQPLRTLAKASQSCSVQSIAYGKCIGKSYQDVSKSMCEAEFRAFKECVQKTFGRKW
ncbi:hypothetical protein BD324DRAFT_637709 [Kockovaella imperatae]|uniref:IMS import disulfide relay-system CHCH-CHCH-like Cx9C domain-containing protein n=1 Tax=Kockovaella imperatae TaxID=4999 RepID=A0A1Y1U7B5_9TREE|nr:hypothetical protein BD324DRAFT_637709 [Kockovaella imperatae]ORX33920.1 hypothetical protein BD324DRAFT_637709 [Kockovaella imperatae]